MSSVRVHPSSVYPHEQRLGERGDHPDTCLDLGPAALDLLARTGAAVPPLCSGAEPQREGELLFNGGAQQFQLSMSSSLFEDGGRALFAPQTKATAAVSACLPACRAKKGKNAAIFEYVSHLLRLSSCSTFFVCPSLPPSVIPFPPARPPARDTRGSTRERKAIVSEHFAIHYSSPLARGRGLRSFGGAVAPWRARAQLRRGCR